MASTPCRGFFVCLIFICILAFQRSTELIKQRKLKQKAYEIVLIKVKVAEQ